MLLWLVATVACWNSIFAEAIPRCEEALPPGFGFGGSIQLVTDCVWTPQVHFVTAISGQLPDRAGPLRAPTIVRGSAEIPSTSSGPSVVKGVVFQNFTLSNPAAPQGQVLWPVGLLQPGIQQGTNMPLKLHMQDVEMLVDAGTLQQYIRFFQSQRTLVYTDNSTFVYVPWWSDDETLAQGVGLLLEVPGMTALDMAGKTPAAGRNFVTAADNTTIVPLLTSTAGVSTSVPLLVYLSANISLGNLAAGLPLNRPVYIVGKTTEVTSVDFGMEVNQLVMLGTWSGVTFNGVTLENLAPGDRRTLEFAGTYDVLMGYYMWSFLYQRSTKRLALHNCTLSLSLLEVEEYLYKATLYKVQPAGFEEQLAVLNSNIQAWQVNWLSGLGIAQTLIRESTAMSVFNSNYTSKPVAADRLPLPGRINDTTLQTAPGNMLEHLITHVSEEGVVPIGSGAELAAPTSEMMLLTAIMSFGLDLPPGNTSVEVELKQHMQEHIMTFPSMSHVLMGIVVPPVTLNMGYSADFVTLPPDAPPDYLTIVNVAALRLSQGPGAFLPGANTQTPDIYTHLLWSIPRNHQVPSVRLSNVTLWVPASEFSFIRSHVLQDGTNSFRIDLAGGQSMQFTDVIDLKAEGLYIKHYTGPGLEADSLKLRLEAGWSQDGPPRGFWTLGITPAPGKLSDVVVVVLAVCLVTAVVAGVLACLAFVLWRRRTAEARAAADAELVELGKAGLGGHSRRGSAVGGSDSERSSHERNGSGSLNGGQYAGQHVGTIKSQLRSAALEAPVHDSSDSYHLTERAQLTADLARSQFGATRPYMQPGEGDNLGEPGLGRRSAGNVASEAALHRLHSAITTMSQDVLSRRLQVSGPGPGALARPSPMRAVDPATAGGANSPHQQNGAGQNGLQAGSNAGGSSASSHSDHELRLGAAVADAAAAPSASPDGEQVPAGDPAAVAPAAGRSKQRSPIATASVGAVTAGGTSMSDVKSLGELKLLQLVGQGTFGQVYKALWRRRCVAVKVLQLPATAGGSDAAAPWVGVGRVSSHREKMAVMETVVSTTMSHPNIVQVYTYVLQPLLSGQGGSVQSGSGRLQPNSNAAAGRAEDRHAQQQRLLQQEQQQLQQIGGQLEQQGQPVQQPLQAQHAALAAAAGQQIQQQPGQRHAVLAAAAKLQDQQQQHIAQLGEQQPQQAVPPDPGAHDPESSSRVRPPAVSPTAAAAGRASSQLTQSRRRSGSCTDSSQSLAAIAADLSRLSQSLGGGDLARLTPEMAAAAAAALPGAAAVTAAGNSTGSGGHNAVMEDGNSGPQGPVLVGWELRLVMEFCDAGSLRAALDHKLLIDRTTGLPALECVLFLAHDVACAMIHLHSEHLLHGDLKASNVLLKRTAPRLPVETEQSAASAGRGRAAQLIGSGLGLMAKVADFGLSLTLGPTDTHVSQMHMGTLTHMAPELLLHGRASKSSDVYAYGILLWELATGRRPYSGTPVGMLAHKVAQQGWRPAWPGGCSLPVHLLAEACWAQDPVVRPTFEQIVQQLEDMAGQLEQLKQQQAQDMAAAAAPVYHPGTVHHEIGDPGHELTPSLMKDLMPSGFSAGSEHSGEEVQLADSGALYEMSQLSSTSQDRDMQQGVQDLEQQ